GPAGNPRPWSHGQSARNLLPAEKVTMDFGGRGIWCAFAVLVASCALAGCGGGGGGGGSAVSFSFGATGAIVSESDGATSIDVVLHTTLPATTADASVDVVDAGSGTATSGADYAAFAPVTLTFPAGSIDGTTQTVALDPIDDSLVDGGD